VAPGDDFLFKVKESHLDTGLRGIPVGTCRTSSVDPIKGVHYVGIPVGETIDRAPAEVVYLLLHKRWPSNEELHDFLGHLDRVAHPPKTVGRVLEALGGSVHPMKALSIGIEVLIGDEEELEPLDEVMAVIARMPWLMAAIHRLRLNQPLPEPVGLKDGIISAFITALDPAPEVDRNGMASILKTFYILHLDHGGGNLSTFTGKAVASSRADITAALSSAMDALSGPLHGRANQSCLEFVQRVGSDDPVQVEKFVRNEIAAGRPIYGFGHAVLRAEDPRATLQLEVGERVCPNDPLFKILKTLREVASRVLAENPRISNPNPNVDLVSGTLLQSVGFTDAETYTTFFGWSRVSGIGAQILDERNARDGKGVPIYRPKYIHQPAE